MIFAAWFSHVIWWSKRFLFQIEAFSLVAVRGEWSTVHYKSFVLSYQNHNIEPCCLYKFSRHKTKPFYNPPYPVYVCSYLYIITCISQCKRTNCAQIHHWVRYVNWWSLRNHLEPYTALANYIHFPLELVYIRISGKTKIVVVISYVYFFVLLDCTCAYTALYAFHSVESVGELLMHKSDYLSIGGFIYWISCTIEIKVHFSMLRDGNELDTHLSKETRSIN